MTENRHLNPKDRLPMRATLRLTAAFALAALLLTLAGLALVLDPMLPLAP